MWSFGTLSSSYDNENVPVVRHYGSRYYAAIRNQDFNEIWTMDSPIHTPSFQGTWKSVKNSSNGVSVAPRPVSLIAKPGPSGVVGPAAIWVEDIATADVYFDGSWQPIPVVRTPISNISFGSVVSGNYLDYTTRIYNDGNGSLTVNSVTRSSGSAYFTYQGPATPFAIGAGSSQLITIRFAPAAVGSFNATFIVNSNDPATPNTTFSVSGTGAPILVPDIRTPITDIGFGNVPVGNSSDKTTTIYNDGSATLTVNAITRSSGSTEFTCLGPTVPFNITAGGSQAIMLRFAPTTAGSKSAAFNVNSSDPDEANVTFNVAGMGFISSSKNDFNRDGHEDILWRYYGPEGYNVVWYMGSSAGNGFQAAFQNPPGKGIQAGIRKPEERRVQAGLQRPAQRETQAPPKVIDLLRREEPPRVFRDALDAGELLTRSRWESLEMKIPAGERPLMDPREMAEDGRMQIQAINYLGQDMLPAVANPSWEIAGTGDFNSDGKPDILWRYYGPEGYNVVWYMNGANYVSQDMVMAVANVHWEIAGTGDFNSDGKPDILWRYYGPEGYNVVWYMDGANYINQDLVRAVPTSNWRIENH